MSYDLRLSELEFGSLLSYSPRGSSEAERNAREVMLHIKYDRYFGKPPILMSRFISDLVKKGIGNLPFASFFDDPPILVPVPNSSLMKANTLWVPHRLAMALYENGFGMRVANMLYRKKPLPKAATSRSKDRPKAVEHCQSLEIQETLALPNNLLLIDDVVTRGATLIGAANKLGKAFPGIDIRAFAAMRVISDPKDFQDLYDPRIGRITLIGDETLREP
jgi:predicted amidophosphoribosyltransferase